MSVLDMYYILVGACSLFLTKEQMLAKYYKRILSAFSWSIAIVSTQGGANFAISRRAKRKNMKNDSFLWIQVKKGDAKKSTSHFSRDYYYTSFPSPETILKTSIFHILE